jgi:phage shock protein C
MPNRLYRSRRDRMLAGVAGGLAEMWGADPSLVRVLWALLVIFTGGIALLVYIVMAIVVPDEDEVFGPDAGRGSVGFPDTGEATDSTGVAVRPPRPPARPDRGGLPAGVLFGGFLVLLGAFFLVREFLPQIDFDWFWPLILVAIGVVLITSAMGRGPRPGGPRPDDPRPDDSGANGGPPSDDVP